jgi:hypothetical protein
MTKTMMLSTDDTTAPKLMQKAAARFIRRLDQQPTWRRLPSPHLPPHGETLHWKNVFVAGDELRRGHVELFEIPGHFAVLHVCLLPQLHDAFPIMGFDMIAGHAQATGIFMDFSPVVAGRTVPALRDALPNGAQTQFQHTRARPEWGSIFSDDFFAIRPNGLDETEAAISLAHGALDFYLDALMLPRTKNDGCARAGQYAYAAAQRSNPHTFKMLSRHVGAASARCFIDDILFPLPN